MKSCTDVDANIQIVMVILISL